jgi:hypothetical protein
MMFDAIRKESEEYETESGNYSLLSRRVLLERLILESDFQESRTTESTALSHPAKQQN